MNTAAVMASSREKATFKVELTHFLASRSLYTIAGTIESGIIYPDMKIAIDLHSGLTLTFDIHEIGFMLQLVALTMKVENAEQAEFMDALDLAGETLQIVPAHDGEESKVA